MIAASTGGDKKNVCSENNYKNNQICFKELF